MTTSKSSEGTVVVLTEHLDLTADRVIEKLNARGTAVFRCDPADFPQRLTMTARLGPGCWHGCLRTEHRDVAFEDIRSVYYRRPGRFRIDDAMTPEAQRFAEAEARYGFGGVVASLNCFWLNHPARIADTEYKPLQLKVASESGLCVPRSLVTNDQAAAGAFADDVGGQVVYKPLSACAFVTRDKEPAALFTSLIESGDADDPRISLTATLFQEWVPKRHDVRLTAVGDDLFAVAVDVQGSERGIVDWRADYGSHRYVPISVPDDVRQGVSAMLARLGLFFGAFDFAVTPEGQWVFLEINPNGQWGWIEAALDLGISTAIANALLKGTAR